MIPVGKKIYLCSPDLSPLTVINGVVVDSVNYEEHVKDYDVLTFDVDRFINIDGIYIETNGYDNLAAYMNIYLEDIGCFQIQYPSIKGDGYKEVKSVTAYSLEKEFENKTWIGFKVNTGEKDSLEQLATNNLNDLGFAKEFIEFYKPSNKELSLLDLILTKMDGWSIDSSDIDPLLWNLKLSFDEGNINLYKLLTNTIAPKAECIFLFDTIHRKVKAVSKYSLDYETNIFIGYRNLANTIDITVQEDSIYTSFNCEGDNGLTINNVNYNDSCIYDFSYFMCEPYMNNELVSKLNTWIKWRDTNRETFISLNKQRADKSDKAYEIQYRVPNDGDNWEQWDGMDEDTLNENLKYYNALLTSLQVSVDNNPIYDSSGNYVPWKRTDGSIDHELYLSALYEQENGYGGYYTYLEINEYIIPNINIAINNLGLTEDEKEDFIKSYETNWSLYGIEELNIKRDNYYNQLDALKDFAKNWEEMTDEEKTNYLGGEDEYNSLGHEKYIEITSYLGSESTPDSLLFYLKTLNDELKVINNDIDNIDSQRESLIAQSKITHESYGFTENELLIINSLIHSTDYQNHNILSTSIDTTSSKIDREKELFDDSISKLSEVCEPQFSFNVSLDNLLRIEQFNDWEKDCKLLRFIHLGVRDDYSVKLRIVGMSWNPCDITPNLNLEFSNMITSKNGRSDLTNLLDSESNRGSNNSISIGTGNSNSDKEYATALLQTMIKTGLFRNTVGSNTGNTAEVIDEIKVIRIIGDHAKSINLRVEKNGVISAINQSPESITIDASKINLNGYVTISNLETPGETIIDGGNIITGIIDAERIDVDGIFAKDITATGTISGASLIGGNFSSSDFSAAKHTGVMLSDESLWLGETYLGENLMKMGGFTSSDAYTLQYKGYIELSKKPGEIVAEGQTNITIIDGNSIKTNTLESYKIVTTGNIQASTGNVNAMVAAKCNGSYIYLGANTNGYHGLYSNTKGEWIVLANSSGVTHPLASDIRKKNLYGRINRTTSIQLLSLPVYEYAYKTDEQQIHQYGVIAQDVRDVMKKTGYTPLLTIEDSNGEIYTDVNIDENTVTYGIDYSKFVPILIDGWQKHEAELKTANERIQSLEERIGELETIIKKYIMNEG